VSDGYHADRDQTQKRKKVAVKTARRVSRHAQMASSLSSWERDVVPNSRAVLTDPVSAGSQDITRPLFYSQLTIDFDCQLLGELWWSGTMPAPFRANLWSACIGNGLAASKGQFNSRFVLEMNAETPNILSIVRQVARPRQFAHFVFAVSYRAHLTHRGRYRKNHTGTNKHRRLRELP
jgi:hypothetical protein